MCGPNADPSFLILSDHLSPRLSIESSLLSYQFDRPLVKAPGKARTQGRPQQAPTVRSLARSRPPAAVAPGRGCCIGPFIFFLSLASSVSSLLSISPALPPSLSLSLSPRLPDLILPSAPSNWDTPCAFDLLTLPRTCCDPEILDPPRRQHPSNQPAQIRVSRSPPDAKRTGIYRFYSTLYLSICLYLTLSTARITHRLWETVGNLRLTNCSRRVVSFLFFFWSMQLEIHLA